jgi:tetratricopeptide (TPR) repeat protein
MAMALGDAYRLKLFEVYFSAPPLAPEAREKRRKDINHLAEVSAHWYLEAEKRSPKDDIPGVRRASVLDLQGKFDEAEDLYLRGLEMRPHSQFIRISYGNHLWRKGDLEGAKREFEKAIATPGLHRPGDGVDPSVEAREMLEKVKEQIAKGGTKRQSSKLNPRED